jgi:hypothetical protein
VALLGKLMTKVNEGLTFVMSLPGKDLPGKDPLGAVFGPGGALSSEERRLGRGPRSWRSSASS